LLVVPLRRHQPAAGARPRPGREEPPAPGNLKPPARFTRRRLPAGFGPHPARWQKAYREGGFEALKPKPRRDRARPRALSPEVLAKAVALKEELPQRSVRQIADMLAMDPETPVGADRLKVSTLARHLRFLGKTRRLLAQPAKTFRRFEQEGPNQLWQADVCYGPWLPDPHDPNKKRRTYLVALPITTTRGWSATPSSTLPRTW